MQVMHWIFAPTFQRARQFAASRQLLDWRYATRDQFRGVRLTREQMVHILDGFDSDELWVDLKLAIAMCDIVPLIYDLRGPTFPDFTDPAAVEAWLDA